MNHLDKQVQAEVERNLEGVVKEGDDICCSPETKGCGGVL